MGLLYAASQAFHGLTHEAVKVSALTIERVEEWL